MFRLFISALVLLTLLAPSRSSAGAPSVIATWSRVGADGTTLAVTTDSGPLADIDTLTATICTHPEVMMISIGLKAKSFHEVGDNPRDPANFYEDMFFLEFGDVQAEKRVARALATLTGVAVQYATDCTSSE